MPILLGPSVRFLKVFRSFPDGFGGERHVLKDLHFTLEGGRTHLILGRSGTGKSTLLNLIAGIDQPDRGQILIGDVDLAQMGETGRTAFRRAKLGFVFQFFHLLPELTVRENCALPLELNRLPNTDQKVDEWLRRFDLLSRADDFPDQLSGGEQQRVGLVRAVIHRPSLILADEPTGNLDEANSKTVMKIIQDLVRSTGTTAIVVSHDTSCREFADQTWQLRSDGIVAL